MHARGGSDSKASSSESSKAGGGDDYLLSRIVRFFEDQGYRVHGAGDILEVFDQRLKVKPNGTTEDNKLSLLTARCIGACSLAPAVVVDGEMKGKARIDELMAELEAM